MNQRLVRITKTLHDECASSWRATRGFQMLCTEHEAEFNPGQDCPGRRQSLTRGTQVWLAAHEAEALVAQGAAAYVTHEADPEDSIQATLERANRAFNQSGLPSVDADYMDSFRRAVRTSSAGSASGVSEHYGASRPARPSRLAGSLGLSNDDIAAMKAAIRR